ncbi:hypothetical protein HDV04_002465 [Boothiomyces sp. JEL0838]|nr:hypothetical protein HDV04_002465 [Boothiomyces sp. JEL0838]
MIGLFISALLSVPALAVGENCQAPSTLWEQHMCQVATNPTKYQALCTPKRQFPGSATSYDSLPAGSVNGVVVMYHGFTACPDAFNEMAATLNQAGYITVIPLLPGQGVKLGFGCDVAGTCVPSGVNPSFLPQGKQGYYDFVSHVNDIVNQELSFIPAAAKADNFQVTSLGLSLGGALTLAAAQQPNSPIQKIMNVNPYMVSAVPNLDFMIENCLTQSDPAGCITSNFFKPQVANITSLPHVFGFALPFINAAATQSENLAAKLLQATVGKELAFRYDSFMSEFLKAATFIGNTPAVLGTAPFKTPYGWGQGCINEAPTRGGYCEFHISDLFVLQAFTSSVMGGLDKIPNTIQYADIHSDMDGPSRDSVSFTIVSKLQSQGIQASRCHFPLQCSLSKMEFSDNLCGAPHSCFSHAEAAHNAPFTLYWEPSLFSNILGFIGGSKTTVGVSGPATDGSVCYTTTTTIQAGAMFDNIGTKYLANSQ